jgi:hypothetical protein
VSDATGHTASKPVIERATALLDASFEALVVPARWCQGAWARDAAGQPIGGSIEEAVESELAAARCLFGELLHQALARGDRIEFRSDSQVAVGLKQAPPSFWLAADALAHTSLYVLHERQLDRVGAAEPQFAGHVTRPERVLASVALNEEEGGYRDVVWALVLAAETLRAELDRRAEAAAR